MGHNIQLESKFNTGERILKNKIPLKSGGVHFWYEIAKMTKSIPGHRYLHCTSKYQLYLKGGQTFQKFSETKINFRETLPPEKFL